MAKKEVKFGTKPPRKPATADEWVAGESGRNGDAMKRFTIDVPASLHRRIKVQCAERGVNMADEIRVLLDKHFPAKS
jgi:hypothetical protein